jgi:hypothetical protein
VVSDGDFEKINAALWDRNYHAHDGADSVSVEFELSWEDWLDYRYIQTTDSKALKQYHSDYLRFSAERRHFSGNAYGWRYTYSSGIARHPWSELSGVGYQTKVITLMTAGGHYPLPRSAFNNIQLESLIQWLDLHMK